MTDRVIAHYRPYPSKSIGQIIKEQEAEGYEFAGTIPGDYSAPMCEYHTPDMLRFKEKQHLTLSDADIEKIAIAVAEKIKYGQI